MGGRGQNLPTVLTWDKVRGCVMLEYGYDADKNQSCLLPISQCR